MPTELPPTPTDTYIYLRGGRGDGFVPLWTGHKCEVLTAEKSEPYRNEFQTSIECQNSGASFSTGFGGKLTTPGHVVSMDVDTVIRLGDLTITPNFGAMSDSVTDSDAATPTPPRQFDKAVSWIAFTSSNGLKYEFRRADVIGWGSRRRDE